jgi:hypothetical protein
MGVVDCVAEAPETKVDIAVLLETDANSYSHVTPITGARSHARFDDMSVAADITSFLIEVAA